MKIRKVLVAGGAGYIGSHCCLELLNNGYEIVCADNYSNSSIVPLQRVQQITGKSFPVVELDLCDMFQVRSLFKRHKVDAAIHLAGHKAVGESIEQPLAYYENNLFSLINLCEALNENGCRNVVFSSSATVYSTDNTPPYDEESILRPSNPYGRTKLYIEEILRDLYFSSPEWNISILRYFNPVGAHASGLIGENPTGIPNNLMPYISLVAVGRLDVLRIFGNDYDTVDGTCIRDFIHVVDLACGHLAALKKLEENPGCITHNLGTGRGYSVLDLIEAFERVNDVEVPYVIAPRRAGDMAINYASTEKAERDLGWKARLGLDEMVRDTWNWQSKNPFGYQVN